MRPLDFDLLGCPVSDYATGRLLGKVKCVVLDHPAEGIARIAVECCADPEPEAAIDPCCFELEFVEPRPQHDYMVGQYATVTLVDPHGHPIIESGSRITPQVLDHARRVGLLHRLSATFRHEAS